MDINQYIWITVAILLMLAFGLAVQFLVRPNEGSYNFCVGFHSGANATTMKNCTLVGIEAGADLTNEDGIIIIGDNIRNLDHKQEGVLFLGDKVAIGETLFGEKINVKEVVEKVMKKVNDTKPFEHTDTAVRLIEKRK